MPFWPFRKRQRDRGRSEPPAPAPRATEPPSRPPTNAWRHLPPLRPTTTALELAAPVQRLAGTITSTAKPMVMSPTLGHARQRTAPTGTVTGLIRPHGRRLRPDGGELPVVRAPEPTPIESAVPLRSASSVPATPSGVQRAPIAAADAGPSATTAPPRLPASSTVTPPTGPITSTTSTPSTTSSTAAAPSTAGSSILPSPPARPMRARELPVAAPAVQSPPEPAPVRQPVATLPAAAAPPLRPDAAPPSDAPRRSVQRLTETPSRPDGPILGTARIVRRVGEPMRSRPASMVEPADAPAALPLAVTRGAPSDAPVAPDPRPAPTSTPGVLPPRPARPMRSSRSRPASSATAPRHGSPGVDAPLVGDTHRIQRLAAGVPVLTVHDHGGEPAAATPPVPVRRGVQRAAESVPPDLRGELEPVLGDTLDDVKVHRGPDVGEAAASIEAKAFTTGGEVYLPDWHGSTASGEGREILAHELTHVVQQRALGDTLPGEDTPVGRSLEAEARAVGGQGPVPVRSLAAAPSGARAAQRLEGVRPPAPTRPLPAAGAVAPRPSGGAVTPPPLATQAAIAARVRAAAASAGIPSSPPPASSSQAATRSAGTPVQRLVEVADVATTATQETGPAANAAAPTPAASSSQAPTPAVERSSSPEDLDDLARRLYPRFRSRLRQDLLADRERAGRLVDPR